MGNRTQKDYMHDGRFAKVMEAAEHALAYERGAREGYRVVQVDGPASLRRDPASKKVPLRVNRDSGETIRIHPIDSNLVF